MSDIKAFRAKIKEQAKGCMVPEPVDDFALSVARARSLMAAGMPDHDICSELDIDQDTLLKLKSAIFESESQYILNQTPLEAYVSYRFKMERICDDLDYVHEGAKEARQFTAAMGALKAKAAIIDRVMDRGQDMGIIPKAATKVRHEIAVQHMTDDQLLTKMKTITIRASELIQEYGEMNMNDVAIPDMYGIGD